MDTELSLGARVVQERAMGGWQRKWATEACSGETVRESQQGLVIPRSVVVQGARPDPSGYFSAARGTLVFWNS